MFVHKSRQICYYPARMTVFLDFDGVICDSVLEAYVSSWIAWYRVICGEEPAAVPLVDRRLFYSYRPFIRNGEDFVLLQRLIGQGVKISSQQQFDRILDQVGAEEMQRYRRAIYAVREELLRHDRDGWLRRNRIYPHVRAELDWLAQRDCCYILSTKKAAYISEILAADAVVWPPERILSTEGKAKLSIIGELLAADGQQSAAFVEDQPDHFPSSNQRLDFDLECYLARWGYVQRQWLDSSRYSTIAENEFGPLMRRLAG